MYKPFLIGMLLLATVACQVTQHAPYPSPKLGPDHILSVSSPSETIRIEALVLSDLINEAVRGNRGKRTRVFIDVDVAEKASQFKPGKPVPGLEIKVGYLGEPGPTPPRLRTYNVVYAYLTKIEKDTAEVTGGLSGTSLIGGVSLRYTLVKSNGVWQITKREVTMAA